MRIVFMGTPEFAVASLEALIENNFNVVAVVTSPDKPAGRGQQLQESAVKKFAFKKNLLVLQPEKLKNEDFIEALKLLKADLQVVVAFRMLPEVVWNMPPLGTINLHASLLPKYRGAAPINWAIINGEKETGVTCFKLQQQIDTGNIYFQEKFEMNDDITAGELHDALMNKGAKLVVKTVTEIRNSLVRGTELKFIVQDDSQTSHAPKIFKEHCKINWNEPPIKINNLIRGLSPYPAAYSLLSKNNGELKTVKIFKSKYKEIEHGYANGFLYTDNQQQLYIYCNGGYIEVEELQIEGKKRMLVVDFLRGQRELENFKFI